ncbi:MAG: glycogen debranching protein GlgX [Notoacmeibacter sp.]|nr:glycogen debranching protein GlgX [Notoacmeibacter sp.]
MSDATRSPGPKVTGNGTTFSVRSVTADAVDLCLFDDDGAETTRHAMRREGTRFVAELGGVGSGTRYGFRADGPCDPGRGLWFDPNKLLMDPYATRIDRRWIYDPRLALSRTESIDTAPLVPKAIVENLKGIGHAPPLFSPGGLIYEVNVRALTMRHPDVPETERGTLRALTHPSVVAHLKKLGVSAVELMPVVAWIDERHLPPLGLANAWGYNPVTFMALEPRLAPGGTADLRDTVVALRAEGIGVILDLVFNHSGESDRHGPTLSFRGLDNTTWYRHAAGRRGRLVNDTGCGNTIACDHPAVRQAIVDSLVHFVRHAGVDGFRFDLAPILGRAKHGFDPLAETLVAIANHPALADRVLIAEPWDIGPGGYQLGNFPDRFLEWNDRYRDDVRRFWRSDACALPHLATRIAGSSDVFAGRQTRSVNFIAAHDGFALADLVAHEAKHNEANGEHNRDGHNENFSWNNGVEGETDDPAVNAARLADLKALLANLFLSRGTVLLTAGDEFGRTQRGNNNAYAQDNELTWLDWEGRDRELEEWVVRLAALRRRFPALRETAYFDGATDPGSGIADVMWLASDGSVLTPEDWHVADAGTLQMVLATGDPATPRMAALFNRNRAPVAFNLPVREGYRWTVELPTKDCAKVPARSVVVMLEHVQK